MSTAALDESDPSTGVAIVSIPDIRRKLGNIGLTTARRLIDAGELEKVTIGRRVFVTAASVRDYLERNRSANRSAPNILAAVEQALRQSPPLDPDTRRQIIELLDADGHPVLRD